MSAKQQEQTTETHVAESRQEDAQAPQNAEGRVNIAEEFYLKVTARPDVRELLRRLAKM